MPVKMFRKKALDLLEVYREPQNDIYPSCDRLIEDLSDFFIVSRSSVKYRLTEVGLIDEICKLEDYDAVFADIHESKEFVALTPVEAYQLLESSSLLLPSDAIRPFLPQYILHQLIQNVQKKSIRPARSLP